MKNTLHTLARLLMLLALIASPRLARANLVGSYTPDSNTLFLLHFDEAAGGSVSTNVGLKGGNFYSVNFSAAGANPPVVTSMLGFPGFVTGPTNFVNCESNATAGYELGYDFNKSGAFQADSGPASPDALAMTNLNIGFGGQSPFTIEALIQPTSTAGSQEIICTDSGQSSRAFQFRINAGTLQFQFITGSQAVSGNIPSSGPNAFVAGAWYHVAVTYNGTTATLYWTSLNPTNGAASVLASSALTLGTSAGAITGPLIIGNRGRPTGTETFLGAIDEVRISSVARAANQMQFYSPLVTVTQNPISQNVDYNQPVTFSMGASSLTAIGYQWRFNSNSIAGATNSSYAIANVAAGDAGYYDCVATNTAGLSATSTEALMVVGAANFLSHRYNFNTNVSVLGTVSDNVGTASGQLYGDALCTNGSLVLDGTTGTYMQLPGNMINATNATAMTVEFWATFGTNPNNVYVFSLGYTNFILGSGIVGVNYAYYTPHNTSGQGLYTSASESAFQQSVTAPGTLDGRTMHVACVIDQPDSTLAIYTNGVLEASFTNLTVKLANLNDVFTYIGASLYPADAYLNASINELRIYNGAISSLSVAQSDLLGPNQVLQDGPVKFVTQPAGVTVPVGQAATLSAAAIGYLPITYQWFKNGTAVPGATNSSYSYVPLLADNGATFSVNATNIIGVTTYVTNSTSATLNVFLPPTLAWLGTSASGANNTWDTTSLDWTNDLSGGGIIAFAQTNGVLFDNRSGGGVDVEQAIIPYNITVNTSSGYAFTSYGGLGLLAGPASLTKNGSGLLDIDVTNNLTGAVTISGGELQIGNGDSFGSLGSGAVTNNATLSINRGDAALVVGNAIHGAGIMSYDGGGTVTVNGTSDYTGNTRINAGIVNLQNSSGLGAASSQTLVANGGQLYMTVNANLNLAGLTLNGSGDGNGAFRKGGAGTTALRLPVALGSDSTIGVDGGATLVLSNTVSGAAMLTVNGTGTLALNARNTYTGGTTVSGGTVNINTNGALGTGMVTINGSAHLLLADGLNLTNFVDASTVNPGTSTGLLMVNDNTNGTVTTISGPLEFDTSPGSGGNFIGPITSGYLNVTGPVTNAVTGQISSRNGFVRFSGGGFYTGLAINQGTVSLGANDGLSTNTLITIGASAAATFDLNGFNQTVTGLGDGAANAELVTNSAATQSTLSLDLSGGYLYAGVLAGNLSLVVNGYGSLDLTGTNAYTGNTTVNGGTLEIAQPTLVANSTVILASGAFLQLDFSVTNTVSGLVLNGVSQAPGVYNNGTTPAYFPGSGSLLVTPALATNPTNIIVSVAGNTLSIAWPHDHLGWILQSQTNSLSAGLSTNWVDVAGSSSATNAVININPANAAVFYRLRHP